MFNADSLGAEAFSTLSAASIRFWRFSPDPNRLKRRFVRGSLYNTDREKALRLFFLIGLFVFAFLSPLKAAAQQAARDEIVVVVTDAVGAPVQGASVVLRNKRTGFERSSSTDARGVAAYRALEPGDLYEISVLRDGFARVLREARVGRSLVIVLEPVSLRAEVTVFSASRQDELRESLSAKVEVLTREQIRDTGYETVGEVLREVPGVLSRRGSEGSVAGEQIQGIDSRQVLVLFDGFPVIGARGIKRGVLNLDRQSTANLQQIEVVKGASSALFGSDAIGGVINLIPREAGQPFESEFRASGGSQGIFDGVATFGFARQKLSAFFTVEQHKRNDADLTPTTFDTTLPAFRRTDLFAALPNLHKSLFAQDLGSGLSCPSFDFLAAGGVIDSPARRRSPESLGSLDRRARQARLVRTASQPPRRPEQGTSSSFSTAGGKLPADTPSSALGAPLILTRRRRFFHGVPTLWRPYQWKPL